MLSIVTIHVLGIVMNVYLMKKCQSLGNAMKILMRNLIKFVKVHKEKLVIYMINQLLLLNTMHRLLRNIKQYMIFL